MTAAHFFRNKFLLLCLLLFSCNSFSQTNILDSLLRADSTNIISKVIANPDKYRLQIIYTKIDRNESCQPIFTDYTFRLKPEEYFYPASMVKLPVVVMALEKIKLLDSLHINQETPFMPLSNYRCKSDTNFIKKRIPESLNTTIKRMLIVSDNDAYNRTYEFLGQEYINAKLKEWGYAKARVIERIALCDTLLQRTTGPVLFVDSVKNIFYTQDAIVNPIQLKAPINKPFVGMGYLQNGKIVYEPKSFEYSNYLDLATIHSLTKGILFGNEKFKISKEDYSFLKRSMGSYPRESGIEKYRNENEFYDGYVKYFLLGGSKTHLDTNIRSFSKVGLSYGFMVESAYIVDYSRNIEFLLSAVIYCNNDEILNDGKYEYDKIGFPFMKRLAWMIYQSEEKRPRKNNCARH